MLQTLFYIPHALGPLPVFGGGGWLMIACVIFSVIVIARSLIQGQPLQSILEQLVFLGIVAAVIALVLPSLESRDGTGEPIGLPIRGYGVMMLIGVLSGVGLAVRRARRVGIHPEAILGLAFWMFIAGIVGARLFYVIEYWESFQAPTVLATVIRILRFTEGGLVVYGSVMGAFAAAAVYALWRKLPLLTLADVISPSLVVGLAFGRIGCLLNGCCYGGICESSLPAIAFPPGSPPYMDHLHQGELLGMRLARDSVSQEWIVVHVRPFGLADDEGIRIGDRFESMHLPNPAILQEDNPPHDAEIVLVPADGTPPYRWSLDELPKESRPVHPTQLYSALNAVLLLAILWFFYPYRPWDGSVFALLMTLYPISRFLIEIIRTDEPGQWGTALSISQFVSLFVLGAVALFWIYLAMTGPRRLAAAAARANARA